MFTDASTRNNPDDDYDTWKDKDEAGSEPANEGDDAADVGDEEGEDEGDCEPQQRLQDPAPLLTTHAQLHLLAMETQPEPLQHSPGEIRNHFS